jgi:hypothetical protein
VTGTGIAVGDFDVDELDRAVDAAILAGDAGGLRVLGYGELTLVLGWPTSQPSCAVKRLPAFADGASLDRYHALLGACVAALERRGVDVIPTDVRWHRSGTELHAYLVQPLVARDALLDRVLLTAPPERGARLLAQLAARVVEAVDARVGLDAQVANWAVDDDRLSCFDVSTPLMRDEQGRDLLDVAVFVSIYPRALHGVLTRIAHGVMTQYFEPRGVLLDAASNLHKEQLDSWLPAFLAAANEHVSPAIGNDEVRRYFRRDRLLWLTMQRLRRADRAWQRRVRRRPYPFLLAPPYAYGPPELPEEDR